MGPDEATGGPGRPLLAMPLNPQEDLKELGRKDFCATLLSLLVSKPTSEISILVVSN